MRRAYLFLTVATLFWVALVLPRSPADPALFHVREVPARVSSPGYERAAFGAGWRTAPGGSCDMRAVVVGAALDPAAANPCTVREGSFEDPYSGTRLAVAPVHGDRVEIDHVFPLSAAWDMGASQWSPAQRADFANDPLNLVAVSRQQNQEKSDQLPGEWLPKRRENRCWYVGRLAQVAVKYELPVSSRDLRIMKRQCLPRIAFRR